MLRRLPVILLALLVSFYVGPMLVDGLVAFSPYFFIPVILLWPKVTGLEPFFYAKVIFGALLLWLLFKGLQFTMGFALPTASRFSHTKLFRRVQGAWAEVLLLLAFFLSLIVIFSWHSMSVREAIIEDVASRHKPFIATETITDYMAFFDKRRADRPTVTYRTPAEPRPSDIEAHRKLAWEKVEETPSWRLQLTIKHAWRGVLFWSVILYGLFIWFVKDRAARVYGAVLRFLEAGRFGFGGSARFAALVEEWPLRWRGKSRRSKKSRGVELFMGRSLYNRSLHVSLQDDRHMLTIAGSRSGKGTTCIIPNLLTWEGSAIVIDPKGTNAAVTAERRRAMGHDVYIVDPFDVLKEMRGSKEPDGFHPLGEIDLTAETASDLIAVIADALVVPDKAERQKHWDDGARTIIRGLITHLLTAPESAGRSPSLALLRDMITMLPDQQATLWSSMVKNTKAGGAARDAASRVIGGIETDEIRNILSNANKHTEWLSHPAMWRVLSRRSFSLKQLREKPTTIYLVLPLFALKEQSRFLRMFVNLAIMQMSMGGRSKIPVLMLLDEFLTLGHMSEVEKAFVFMAGYNLIVWPFAQDYGQLQELYGDSVSSFVTNSRAVQVFGVSDPKTTQFVSEQIGRRSMKYVYGLNMLRSEPFRQPDEIAKEISVESGLQYVLRSGKAPLLLERVPYFESERLRVPLPAGRINTEGLPEFLRTAETAAFNDGFPLLRWLWPFHGIYAKDPDYKD